MQLQGRLTMLRKFALCAALAGSLAALVGCVTSGSLSASVTHDSNTGNTQTVVKGEIDIKSGTQIAMWMPPVSGTDLASLDPTQAIMSYTLSNAEIVSTSGLFTVTIKDDNTGVTIGQQDFQYVVKGTGLVPQDPTAVSNWLDQFASYSNLDVTVTASTAMQALNPGTVTVTNNAVYQGTTYASGSTSWTSSSLPDNDCGSTQFKCLPGLK